MLDERSPELLPALSAATKLDWKLYHTGGGCMVAEAVLEGTPTRLAWVTRDDQWLLGIYLADGSDEGEGTYHDLTPANLDSPAAVATAVADALNETENR